jgi:hypothetical protein
MCFLLFAASPLTLSELRSMLPPGFSADLASRADQAILRSLLPAARTGVRLLVGACSCDLVLARSASREDERELRRRFFAAGMSREQVIAALERHRKGGGCFATPADARAALAGLVAEHARNAGPTLYLLRFGAGPLDQRLPGDPVRIPLRDVRANVDGWLREDQPVIVEP